ncbi:MAG TPA: hypothetical protein VMS17_24285 [Gemmataceae bacterium]|nr:hypothetical protein [Gemmataceae bacterium]
MQCRMNIQRESGETAVLLMGVGRDHSWRLETPASWIPARTGRWVTRKTSTKFSSWSYIELLDDDGAHVFDMKQPPYTVQERFRATFYKDKPRWGFDPGEPVEVVVLFAPNATKGWSIRQTWDVGYGAPLGPVTLGSEHAYFDILDPQERLIATYHYSAHGVSVGVPFLDKFGKVGKGLSRAPGASTTGPWNDFTAPEYLSVDDFGGDAWIQTFLSVGMGFSKSYVDFQFGGHQEGRVGYLVHLPAFQTGSTYGLPSSSITSGTMTLAVKGRPYTP